MNDGYFNLINLFGDFIFQFVPWFDQTCTIYNCYLLTTLLLLLHTLTHVFSFRRFVARCSGCVCVCCLVYYEPWTTGQFHDVLRKAMLYRAHDVNDVWRVPSERFLAEESLSLCNIFRFEKSSLQCLFCSLPADRVVGAHKSIGDSIHPAAVIYTWCASVHLIWYARRFTRQQICRISGEYSRTLEYYWTCSRFPKEIRLAQISFKLDFSSSFYLLCWLYI